MKAPFDLSISTSRTFPEWLFSQRVSIAVTTYQVGKLILLGISQDGRLSAVVRDFQRCMGIAASPDAQSLYLASELQVVQLDNVLTLGQLNGKHDALYAPHRTWVTGDIDIHDLALGEGGRLVFANTLFNCVATTADRHSFRPIWRPPFISKLVAEDRCHLNGIAVEGGIPKFVTCVSTSDATDGWRDRRMEGGVLIDVASNEIVTRGLSMPHSPRLRDGKLWLLNSGTGAFGWVNEGSGRFDSIAFCPGYARGLAFVGKYALVGLSMPRDNKTFEGLALDGELTKRNTDARCGILVIDLNTGSVVEWLRIEGVITELFDVAILPGVRCPSAVGMKGSEVRRTISIEAQS
jgi:uncharacterized protein (TIGR03032 family)